MELEAQKQSQHGNDETVAEGLQCKVCKVKFDSETELNNHKKSHKEFRCNLCWTFFSQKIEKTYHKKRARVCEVCGKIFCHTSDFYDHYKMHVERKKATKMKLLNKMRDTLHLQKEIKLSS